MYRRRCNVRPFHRYYVGELVKACLLDHDLGKWEFSGFDHDRRPVDRHLCPVDCLYRHDGLQGWAHHRRNVWNDRGHLRESHAG